MPNFKNSRMAEDIKREMTAIYVSSLSGMESTLGSVKGLRSAEGFIRRELFHRLKMRKSPELTFVADNSIERSAEISRKLNELNIGEDE